MVVADEPVVLSRQEQLERLWAMVERVLPAYGLRAPSIRLLEQKKNVTFRIDEAVEDGEPPRRYVMRVCEIGAEGYNEAEIRSELQYLRALSRGTGLRVPDPVNALDGSLVIRGEADGLPPRFCALFHWVPGRMVNDAPSPQLLERVGAISARIHLFSETFVPPPGFSRPRWDGPRLFGVEGVLAPGQGEPLISDRGRELLEEAAQVLREEMARLGEGSDVFGIIHKDLEPDNTVVDGDEVHAIDFADLGWGYYLYDIAASLLPLREKQGFKAMRDAFLRGYNRVRPLRKEHEALVETFLIGRSIFSVRLMTGKLWDFPPIREYANTAVPQILGGIRQFLAQRSRGEGTVAARPETAATRTTVQFLSLLREKGIKLWAEGEKLRFNAPPGTMTPAVTAELKDRKYELLSFLRQGHVGRRSSAPTRVVTPEMDRIPLSFAQQRLWFIDRLFPNSPQYNIARAVRLTGPVRVGVLEASLNEVVRRHAALRTTFAEVDGQPVQRIAPTLRVPLPVIDLRGLPVEAREPEAWRVAKEDARRPFDLTQRPLLRVMLLRLAADDHMAPSTMHHIIGDGWSSNVLFQEMGFLYTAFVNGEVSPLPELAIQYADFAVWQRGWLQGEVLEEQLAYWKEQLAGAPQLDLPTDRPRSLMRKVDGDRQPLLVPPQLAEALRSFAQAQGATMFMILLAAFKTVLARSTGQDDIVVGSPIASRNRTEIEGLIGFFANTLVLRTQFPGNPSFREMLAGVRRTTLGAYAHQDLPFEKIVEELRPERSASDTPFFQVIFTLQNVPNPDMQVSDFRMALMPPTSRAAMFDLTCNMKEMPDGVRTSFMYKVDLFDAATVARLARHYLHVLQAVVADPSLRLGEIPLLGRDERHQVLAEWNATAVFPVSSSLHEQFAAQAAERPEAVAVVSAGESLTYGALNARANRLAHRLRALGVGPEVPVGLCLERSLDMVVAILAVLKAGGAYVPLDPAYPKDRLAFALADARPRVLLTHERLAGLVPEGTVDVLSLDSAAAGLDREPDTDPLPLAASSPDNLAYVIYTSGSTGQPKGSLITHRNVLRLFAATDDWFGFGAGDTWTLFHSYAFDFSVWELWGALLYGGRLVVVPYAVSRSAGDFYALLAREGVTVLNQTPSAFRQLVRAEEEALEANVGTVRPLSLRTVIFGGEALELAALEPWFARHGDGHPRLINMYGITETTVHVTYRPVTREDLREAWRSPIGVPIPDLRVYVLDRFHNLAPAGVVGEMYVGGPGLGRGYLNRPDLTAERFVPDLFGGAGERLYKTGDLARYVTDGAIGGIEYLGRIDHQVKIRGFRIELGEIEAVLVRLPEVRDAVVTTREVAPGDRRLVAYLVAASAEPPTPAELREALGRSLPDYMIPSAFVVVAALPLNANGKVDFKALPEPGEGLGTAAPAYVAPRSELERLIAGVWCEVLKVEKVGVEDNFFDLGGHSLLMIEVQSRLKRALGREIEVLELFRSTTVSALARFLAGEEETAVLAPAAAPLRAGSTEIAVIAMAGRFPGARDVEELWQNLSGGVESIRFFSREEMLDAGFSEALIDRPEWVAAAGVLDDIELFDAGLFGFNPREAEILDPQQRLFLECAWEALERAGHAPGGEARVGVFASAALSSYALNNLAANTELIESVGRYQTLIGNDKDYLATRTSYCLNLRGPSLSVQTGCSSSLVAVALACQALLEGQCELALAGGVSIEAQQKAGYLYEPGHIASRDGHCRAFDAGAAGTVGGSGVGLVVLKPLAAALEDGDEVLAVIRGAAINNDGARKAGYTAPSIQGQAEVIAAAHAAAGVDPATIGYVEAHGTATTVGDPIEVAGLTRAFAAGGRSLPPRSVAIGSVKTNLGHLDTAAGITGLIKTVLSLQHRQIPPSLHFERPNPQIDFAAGPFYVNTALADWPAGSEPRRAGVSSFGIGGTNAHVVVEEAPARLPAEPSRARQLFVLSAATPAALEAATDRLVRDLAARPDLSPADVAFTLAAGRRGLAFRRAVVAVDLAEAAAALGARDPQRMRDGEARERPVAFLFPGQGAQYAGMAQELYDGERIFRDEVDRCAEALAPHLAAPGGDAGLDVRTFLFPAVETRDAASARLRETWLTQPALFVVEYALARLLASWGVSPRAMIGHSVGEYVAACLAGVLSLPDALAVVAARGRLMAELPGGAMLSVYLPAAEVEPLLGGDLSVAALNAPGLTVVSGPQSAIEELARVLAERGIEARPLHTSHAFHSAMMDPVLARFRELLGGIALRPPSVPFLSGLTGTWITPEQATDPGYWTEQMRRPVRFVDGLAELLSDPNLILLEVGPGRALSELARQQPAGAKRLVVASMRRVKDDRSDLDALLDAVGRLWTAGTSVSWSGFYAGERRRRVLLPTYPFEHKRYWIEGRHPLARAAERRGLPEWRKASLPSAVTIARPIRLVADGDRGAAIAERLRAAGATVADGWEPIVAAEAPVVYVPLAGDIGAIANLLALARGMRGKAHLTILAERSLEVDAGDAPSPEGAALAGAVAALRRELPDLSCRLVDLEDPASAKSLDQAVSEILASASGLRFVAYRSGYRWERTFGPVGANAAAVETAALHDRPELAVTFAAPVTPAEQRIAEIWRQLLGVDRVGLHDDFFELGGHSLLATRLTSRLRDDLGVELSLDDVFAAPTVGRLAARVEASHQEGDGTRIVRVPREGDLPLSFGQQRLWFLHQLMPDSPFYNIPLAVRLSGDLDAGVLARSLEEIVRRHEALRTTFTLREGRPVQVIAEPVPFVLPVVDLSGSPTAEQEVARLANEEAGRSFDLSKGPLLRACLVRLTGDEHAVLVTIHHIATDAWSIGVFVRELAALYGAFVAGEPSPLLELPVQYADFAQWQREHLLGRNGAMQRTQMAYWRERLGALPPPLDLATDRPRPAIQKFYGAARSFTLDRETLETLGKIGRGHGATLFMTLLAGLDALLHRYTGQTDLTVGAPIANRTRSELEELIGFFVNTLVLRCDLSGDPAFGSLLDRVRVTTLGAQSHQDLPFEMLVEELKPERDLSRTPLFQVLFALQNVPTSRLDLPGLTLRPVEAASTPAAFDLTLYMEESAAGLAGRLVYNAVLFDGATIVRFGEHFRNLLAGIAADPGMPLSALPLLGAEERQQLLAEWNDTAADLPMDTSLQTLFEAQVARTPQAVAVAFDEERITYAELDARAGLLACHLRTLRVGPESLVGVCAERSVEMVVGLLAVLKAGGAYVPIDPGYPEERLAFMLEDAGADVLLTQERLLGRLPADATRISLDRPDSWNGEGDTPDQPRADINPGNLAYVIYTSGSTGRPKGAMNTHRAICNRLLWMQQAYRLTADDRVLQKTPFSFDVSVWEFFWPLIVGARLVVANPGGHLDPDYLSKLIEREEVTTIHFVPSMLQLFLQGEGIARCRSLRRVIVSGEALPAELERRFFTTMEAVGLTAGLHNLYGPTEAAVDVTSFACSASDRSAVPIGRPISNLRIHVLDRDLRLAPIGVPGELHIGGAGLARGYWRRPDLTAARFVPDPWGGEAGARLYKTGDLVRLRGDGEIEFLARIDHQVKVRGFRIELGEIEAALARHPQVSEAIVLAREVAAGDIRLIAYVVPAEPSPTAEDLRNSLHRQLPEYMVPQAFVMLEAMPLSPNGKVDRRALPLPEALRPDMAARYVAPASGLEESIAEVWREVLRVDRVGLHDNFFELGGHSLLLVQVTAELRKRLGRDLVLTVMFQYPTVGALAAHLSAGAETSLAAESETIAGRAAAGRERLRQQALRQRRAAEGLDKV